MKIEPVRKQLEEKIVELRFKIISEAPELGIENRIQKTNALENLKTIENQIKYLFYI